GWLAAESEADLARRVEAIGADIEQSSAVGKEQEALNSLIAPDDNALRLERRFQTLSVPGRLRLGLGTSQLVKAAGWDAKRHRLGVHVTELLEALESIEPIGGVTIPQPASGHPEYGELVRLTGLTSAGRAITLVARGDRPPLVLVAIAATAACNPSSPPVPLSLRESGDHRGVDLTIPVRDGVAKAQKTHVAVHPVGRLVARVVLRAGAGVEEAVVESDVYDLSAGARLDDDL